MRESPVANEKMIAARASRRGRGGQLDGRPEREALAGRHRPGPGEEGRLGCPVGLTARAAPLVAGHVASVALAGALVVVHVRRIGSGAAGAARRLLRSLCPQPRAFFRTLPRRRSRAMANIKQQKKRIRIAADERLENLRYRSTIKTLTKRLATAVEDGEAETVAAEHRNLVRLIDRAVSRGALHRNTGARKKSQAARLTSPKA